MTDGGRSGQRAPGRAPRRTAAGASGQRAAAGAAARAPGRAAVGASGGGGGRFRLAAEAVLGPDGWVGPATVVVEDGLVAALERSPRGATGRRLVPGFVDLQVNGIDDVDVAHAAGSAWDHLDRRLAAQGVTTWCPTLLSAPLVDYPAMLERIAAAANRPGAARPAVAGVHLEGPFLGDVPGAHRAEWLRPPDPAFLDRLPDIVRVVTLGPERPGALDAVARLSGRGVLVALGHTAAEPARVHAAAGAGARLVTHLFNAMAPFHQRAPGPVGAALVDDRLACSVIADGHHVDPVALALAWRAKGPQRMVLVSDSVARHGGRLGGVPLAAPSRDADARAGRGTARPGAAGTHPCTGGDPPRRPDGTLAGSALRMDDAIRFVVARVGVPLEAAVRAASTNPARLLGLHDRGIIAPGRRADLVALSGDLTVEATWLAGHRVER